MKILLLGATGNIGQQVLETVDNKHKIVGISYNNNHNLARQLIKKHKIKFLYSPLDPFNSNVDSYEELFKQCSPDLVINAVSGYAGLKLSHLTLKRKIDLALANKESLVMAGKFLIALAKKNHVNIFPLDSEHAAIHELLLQNQYPKLVDEIIITCSGGKFYDTPKHQLKDIMFSEAVKHPNWNMGYKISIDSSTLVNKCFEIVEAHWLFKNINIKVLYHPQSIVHGMIRFKDGSVYANMSTPDMKYAIDLVVNKFIKQSNKKIKELSFKNLQLTFDEIDEQKWKPIKWAYDIINDKNDCLGIIINVANEQAIEKFKHHEIRFDQIITRIEAAIKKYSHIKINSLDDIYQLIEEMKNN